MTVPISYTEALTYLFVTAPGGAVVEHFTCDEVVCEIEEGDSLATILSVIQSHRETCTGSETP